MIVLLETKHIDFATSLATGSHQRNEKNPRQQYPNTLPAHIVGKLGEVAVEKWLRDQGLEVEPVYRMNHQEHRCDLAVRCTRIEVKTWSRYCWLDWGRCVTPGQAKLIEKKADVIVWVSAEIGDVRIEGWNPSNVWRSVPVIETGPSHNRIANHQIPVKWMRKPEVLLAHLRLRTAYEIHKNTRTEKEARWKSIA